MYGLAMYVDKHYHKVNKEIERGIDSALKRSLFADADLPCLQVPYAHIAIASTADHGVPPGHHGPDSHDMTLQSSHRVAIGIEDMNFGVIEGDDDVLLRQMQASDYASFLCDIASDACAARSPSRFHEVSLLEVGLV